MGRPLFSQQYATTAPTVRVEPEQIPQTYERWDWLNPFDPDSDEFFANAELETPVNILPDDAGRPGSPVIPLVLGTGSSDFSSSGSSSPTEETHDEGAFTAEELDTRIIRGRPRRADSNGSQPESASAYTYRVPILPPTPPPLIPATSYVRAAYFEPVAPRPRSPSRSPSPEHEHIERVSPSPSPSPARVPSTPPRVLQPSPPPSVTPRLYTWSGARAPPGSPTPAPALPRLHPGFMPAPPHLWAPRYTTAYTHAASSSPPSSSPLPNLGARMSVAHITPSITSGRIRV